MIVVEKLITEENLVDEWNETESSFHAELARLDVSA